mgnify:CR=1 FL=1
MSEENATPETGQTNPAAPPPEAAATPPTAAPPAPAQPETNATGGEEAKADTTPAAYALDFGVYGVPETFLIDAEGWIRYKLTGALSVQTLQDQLLPAIAALESNGQPSGNTSPRPNPAP